MRFLNSQWPKHAFQFGGGGASRFLDPLGLFKKSGNQAAAIAGAPVPMPSPPVTQNNEAVVQAEHDLARAGLAKKSIKNTVFAGDTGGYGSTGGRPGTPQTK